MGDENVLFLSQQLLEQNEDIIAAIVENMQLGRIDDCIKHYSVLHKNLVSMSLALDNFPSGNLKPYEEIGKFPDEIMRKDILDDLRPLGQTSLPVPPLPPPCRYCMDKKSSAHKCRVELGHVEPAATFSTQESQEFLKVSQLMEMRCRSKDISGGAESIGRVTSEDSHFHREGGPSAGPPPAVADGPGKRSYRVWQPWETYTVCLGIHTYGGTKGARIGKIRALLDGRSESQLRSYIAKKFTDQDIADLLAGKLPACPKNYIPPRRLSDDMARSSSLQRLKHLLQNGQSSEGLSDDEATDLTVKATRSQVAPRQGRGDWTRLMGLVDGHTVEPDVRYEADSGRIIPTGLDLHDSIHINHIHPSIPSVPLPAGTDIPLSTIPAIPSFTHIAMAAPLQNPVRDASELLGGIGDAKTHGSATAKWKSQDKQHSTKESKKKKQHVSLSLAEGTSNSKKQRMHSRHETAHGGIDSFGEDDNSLVGHMLGGFGSYPLSGDMSSGHFGGLFHDSDSLMDMGGERRGELIMEGLSNLSEVSWQDAPAGQDWSREYGMEADGRLAHAPTERNQDNDGDYDHPHSSVIATSQPFDRDKTRPSVREKREIGTGKRTSMRSGASSTSVSNSAINSSHHLHNSAMGAIESDTVELICSEHSFLPGVSDEFSML